MTFDYLNLLSFIFFFMCFLSLSYIIINNFTQINIFELFTKSKSTILVKKFMKFETYLRKEDYLAYEKYEIWRYYFPA